MRKNISGLDCLQAAAAPYFPVKSTFVFVFLKPFDCLHLRTARQQRGNGGDNNNKSRNGAQLADAMVFRRLPFCKTATKQEVLATICCVFFQPVTAWKKNSVFTCGGEHSQWLRQCGGGAGSYSGCVAVRIQFDRRNRVHAHEWLRVGGRLPPPSHAICVCVHVCVCRRQVVTNHWTVVVKGKKVHVQSLPSLAVACGEAESMTCKRGTRHTHATCTSFHALQCTLFLSN